MNKEEINKIKLFETGRVIRQFLWMCAEHDVLLYNSIPNLPLDSVDTEEMVHKFLVSESDGEEWNRSQVSAEDW